MGWLQRMFGGEKAEAAAAAPADAPAEVPPERVGLNGEYDQSGLAKRVAQAFDMDGSVGDIDTLWVAQTGSNVVLKGKVPDQGSLDRLVEIARNVNGASAVDTNQVEVTG
jgi:hypothetical protein